MSPSKLSTRFVIFVIVSLMTHLLELATSALLCHTLMQQTELRMPWFSVAAGLLILPIVVIQLASAVFLLRRKGETFTPCEIATTAILHVLQLGFISRHFIILRETPMSSKRKEIIEMMLLRVSFAFTSGSTLFFVQVYLLLQVPHQGGWIWTVYFSGATNLISVAWAVSTSHKCLPDPEFCALLITWPGSLLKLAWRAGELLARIISAALFASLYIRFLFLVIGLHWLSMLVCLYIPLITSIQWPACGSVKKTLIRLMISFTHIFTFINTSVENSVFRYTFYYVIFFLENATLITVWFVQSSSEYFSRNSIFAYVAVVSFIASVTSMIIYYKYVHIPVSKASPVKNCENSLCMACNLADISNCQSGPTNLGVVTTLTDAPVSLCSYQSHQKNYFVKDGTSECNGCANTKGRNFLHNASSLSQSNTENTSSSLDETDKKHSNKHEYTALELKLSPAGVHSEQANFQMSQKQPVWLPSGDSNFANQLLTYTLDNFDAAETADSERSSDITESVGYPVNRLSPSSQTAAYERNSVAGTSSNTSQPLNQQRPPQAPASKIVLNNLGDSENMCSCTSPCAYKAREIPTPDNDVPSTPESRDISLSSKAIPPCLHADMHRHHYHFHQHHHKNLSPVTVKENLQHLNTENKNQYPSKDVHSTQECTSCIHPPLVSSTSCYKNKKRKHSQQRKLHISTAVGTLTSPSTSTEQRSLESSSGQDHPCSPSKNLDLSLAQHNQLAIELLKPSFHPENRVTNNTSDFTTVPTSDPRFSVRVMTSPVSEISTCNSLVSSKTSNKTINTIRDNVEEYSELGPRKHQQTDIKSRKTFSTSRCRLADVVSRPVNESCQVVPYGLQVEVSSATSKRTDVSADREDNVYENIWSTEKRHQLKQSTGWEGRYKMADDCVPKKSDKREFYSESEDSALPMEFLSSSAEVFTGSNSDSDISLEIVI